MERTHSRSQGRGSCHPCMPSYTTHSLDRVDAFNSTCRHTMLPALDGVLSTALLCQASFDGRENPSVLFAIYGRREVISSMLGVQRGVQLRVTAIALDLRKSFGSQDEPSYRACLGHVCYPHLLSTRPHNGCRDTWPQGGSD